MDHLNFEGYLKKKNSKVLEKIDGMLENFVINEIDDNKIVIDLKDCF